MPTDHELNKILSRIGKLKPFFKYPGDDSRGHRQGILKDRTGLKEPHKKDEVAYWVVADLIDFSAQSRPERFMRFGYYRGSSKNWGSQTTLTMSLPNWKRLFVKAAREKKWFRRLLESVMTELDKSDSDPATH
jgi:hypothetical protein